MSTGPDRTTASCCGAGSGDRLDLAMAAGKYVLAL
jgi:hypothetical protein